MSPASFIYLIGLLLLAVGLSSYWRPTGRAVLWWPRMASVGAWAMFACTVYLALNGHAASL